MYGDALRCVILAQSEDENPCPFKISHILPRGIFTQMNLLCGCLVFNFVSQAASFLLDVGAPRTGTQSMYRALQILGLDPLHSGMEIRFDVRDAPCGYLFGNSSANRSLDDVLAILDGRDGAMDEPFMLLYEEIMAAFPDAKFLLTISDPESWYESYTKLALSFAGASVDLGAQGPPYMRMCTAMTSWGCEFGFHSDDVKIKKECLQSYHQHNERVQEVIPPDRLLVYNWSDGWAPLAHFVDRPVPDEDFPHVDEILERMQWLAYLRVEGLE